MSSAVKMGTPFRKSARSRLWSPCSLKAELAHDREQVRRMQALQFLVQSARRPEVRQPELAARVLDAVAQHVERPPPGNFARQPAEEARLHVGSVVLPQLLPHLRLGGQEEVDDVGRDQAQPAVVVFRPAPEVAPRQRLVPELRRRLPHRRRVVRAGVRPVAQQRALDGGLEGAFRDVRGHGTVTRDRVRRPVQRGSRTERPRSRKSEVFSVARE